MIILATATAMTPLPYTFGNENYIITYDYSGNSSNHIIHHTFGDESYITIKIQQK